MYRHMMPGITAFSALSAHARAELMTAMHLRTYRKGSMLYTQGEAPEAAFFIEKGRVKWHKVSEDGVEQTLQVVEAGEGVGLVALLDRNPYIANAEALEDSSVWVLSLADFDRLVLEHPEIALEVMQLLGNSLRWLLEHVHTMTTRSATERVSSVLARKAVVTDTGHHVIPLTHQEIAHLAGIARETVSRVLAEMQRQGTVRLTRSAVILVNTAQLGPVQQRIKLG